jgi:NAD(P)-dependent dehydrogenase (short-subunit alcohol dehydrogenase family)
VAASVVAEIEASGGVATADGNDVASPRGAEALVECAVERFGRIDAVINNAGIIRWAGFPESEAIELEAHLAVHVAGSYNVSRAAWPHMVAQGFGRILMTTSTAIYGAPVLLSYGAAKGGVVGLARALATHGADHGILVNVISPMAYTRMMASAGVEADDDIARRSPPELVSQVAAYLIHDSCTETGQIYAAGGGRVALVFLGETFGFQSDALTAEAVRDHWSEINDRSHYFVPASTRQHHSHVEELGVQHTGRFGRSPSS